MNPAGAALLLACLSIIGLAASYVLDCHHAATSDETEQP